MTFLVFVAYGGNEAKQVAEQLGEYMEQIGISTFLASSKFGKWLIPGNIISIREFGINCNKAISWSWQVHEKPSTEKR